MLAFLGNVHSHRQIRDFPLMMSHREVSSSCVLTLRRLQIDKNLQTLLKWIKKLKYCRWRTVTFTFIVTKSELLASNCYNTYCMCFGYFGRIWWNKLQIQTCWRSHTNVKLLENSIIWNLSFSSCNSNKPIQVLELNFFLSLTAIRKSLCSTLWNSVFKHIMSKWRLPLQAWRTRDSSHCDRCSCCTFG